MFIVVTIPVPFYGGNNEGISWLVLKPMHIAAKLTMDFGDHM
jgi:hypothetical protein